MSQTLYFVVACVASTLDDADYMEESIACYLDFSHAQEHANRAKAYYVAWKKNNNQSSLPYADYQNVYDKHRKLERYNYVEYRIGEIPFFCHFDQFLEENNL
jgi:hypothetical protein